MGPSSNGYHYCPDCYDNGVHFHINDDDTSYIFCECGWSGSYENLLTELEYKQRNRKNKLKKLKYEN